ncbi:flavin reductase ActVB [Lentzea xinjiangensis]|uniref:Flavin reductase ActVB n=1 Tax=Lentzea xinjiangensis TaxID=402600 RepID=A0A1H9K147_9PSEU|nr:flavin reductase family protein [Lentzea xinjiangensis]SEQ92697.1 flavin reductase ActVB [Lentzea xinjiangensis]
MTATEDVASALPVAAFTDAMSRLVSGLAVVTTRQAGGQPCGLLVSSICSYSVAPPSVLVVLDHASRCRDPLARCAEFGVHVLGSDEERTARTFASRGADKFAGVGWEWDGAVPRLCAAPIYLRCTAKAVFDHGDHTVLIGEVTRTAVAEAEPLVCYRRQFDWGLRRNGVRHP